MKKRNLTKGLMFSTLALTFTLTGVSAASRSWSTTTLTSIPGGGESQVSTAKNLKASADTEATYNSLIVGPALGVSAKLVAEDGKTTRAEKKQAKEGRIVYASETADCEKGKYYRLRVYSNTFEWSNGNKATVRFSADKR